MFDSHSDQGPKAPKVKQNTHQTQKKPFLTRGSFKEYLPQNLINQLAEIVAWIVTWIENNLLDESLNVFQNRNC